MTLPWTCDRCTKGAESTSTGTCLEPTDPDAKCALCGARPSEVVRIRLLLERVVRLMPAQAVRMRLADSPATAPRRRAVATGILSKRAAARRLGVGRDTIDRIVASGLLASVPKGARRGFRAADVDALIERGFTLPDAAPTPTRKPKRRRAPKSTDAAVQRIADLPY